MDEADAAVSAAPSLMAQLLQQQSSQDIITWLSATSSVKKKDGAQKTDTNNYWWKEFQQLRLHFATSFTDFLHEDCKHLLGEDDLVAVPRPPQPLPPLAALAIRPEERQMGARRRLGVDPAPISVRRDSGAGGGGGRPADSQPTEQERRPSSRTVTDSEGRSRSGGGGGRGRRWAGGRPATEPRAAAGAARDVQLSDLIVSGEGRPARRGRRNLGGRPAGEAAPEPAPAAAADSARWKKLDSRLGPADGAAWGARTEAPPAAAAPAAAPAPAEGSFVTPVKQMIRHEPNGAPAVGPAMETALPAEVTHAERLDSLAALYAHLIDHNHLLGLSIELNFLVRLLVAPGGGGEPPPATSLFVTSVHNGVYLATRTLWLLREQLGFLDAANLRLLAANSRLAAFAPRLAGRLLELPDLRPCLSPPPGRAAAADDDRPDSLAFYAELVYRPNFPSDAAFHAFRRQHDLLHQLVARFRADGGRPDWDAAAALGDEPRALVALCAHPVNMHHLARLFQAQLLLLAGEMAAEEGESAALLQQADRSRLQRLNDRFLKPVCVGRAGGRRDFPGAQELFRQLVLLADSAEFSAALRDLLASSVLELDGQALQLPETGVLPSTVREVSERIFRLRLLAKFLGLVTFRGLHSDEDIPEQVLTRSIQMRNRLPPPLDLLSCLESAVRRRQLVMTLPWLIEYVCMMDRVSVLTSAHQTVFSLLVRLFRSLGRAPGLTRHNALFLRLQYENLYEIHSHVQNLREKDDLAAMDGRRVDVVMAEFWRRYQRPAADAPASVDARDLVRPSLFYVCCPYLTEQKVALLQFRAGRAYQPSPALRKIIPIAAQAAGELTAAARQTQVELEEGFFQSHHPSLRRTTSFVVERLASALIKLTRSTLLEAATAPLLAPLLRQLALRVERQQQDYQIKSWLQCRLSELVLEQHAAVVAELASSCRSRVEPLVSAALGALLVGEELTSGARHTCHRLAEAGILNRLNCWLNTNVTRDFMHHVMEEECRADLRRLRRGAEPSPPPEQGAGLLDDLPDSDSELESPSSCLVDVKDALCDLLSGARPLAGPELEALMARMAAVHGQWRRLVPAAGRALQEMALELVTAVVCVQPELLSAELLGPLSGSWSRLTADPLAQLLAAPLQQQLAASRRPAESGSCARRLLVAAGATAGQLAALGLVGRPAQTDVPSSEDGPGPVCGQDARSGPPKDRDAGDTNKTVWGRPALVIRRPAAAGEVSG